MVAGWTDSVAGPDTGLGRAHEGRWELSWVFEEEATGMRKGQHRSERVRPPGPPPFYRRLLRTLANGLARLAHSRRRTQARAKLERYGLPRSILVLCTGNICRSPYAAALLRRHLAEFLESEEQIQSAGFIGPGRAAPQEAIRVAAARDLDLSGHRSQLITERLVRGAEVILVMSGELERTLRNRFPVGRTPICVLGDLDPVSIDAREIRDPFQQELRVFELAYARIDRCVTEFVRAATAPRGTLT